jgi:hypothetical protein
LQNYRDKNKIKIKPKGFFAKKTGPWEFTTISELFFKGKIHDLLEPLNPRSKARFL